MSKLKDAVKNTLLSLFVLAGSSSELNSPPPIDEFAVPGDVHKAYMDAYSGYVDGLRDFENWSYEKHLLGGDVSDADIVTLEEQLSRLQTALDPLDAVVHQAFGGFVTQNEGGGPVAVVYYNSKAKGADRMIADVTNSVRATDPFMAVIALDADLYPTIFDAYSNGAPLLQVVRDGKISTSLALYDQTGSAEVLAFLQQGYGDALIENNY